MKIMKVCFLYIYLLYLLDREIFLENVYKEINSNVLPLSTSLYGSKILERLLRLFDISKLVEIYNRLLEK